MAINPLALGVGQGVGQGIGSAIGDVVGGRNDRRHAKEQGVQTLGNREYTRRWQAQQQARQRAFEALMQQMMLGLQGHEGAQDRAANRYMTDAQLRAEYGDVALGGNIGGPIFGTDAYWERMGRQAPYDPYQVENVVPEDGASPFDEYGVEFDTISGDTAKDIAHGDGGLPGATRDNRGQRGSGRSSRERKRHDDMKSGDDAGPYKPEISAPGGGYTRGGSGIPINDQMPDDMDYTYATSGPMMRPEGWWLEDGEFRRTRR